ncbi:hypothetical protein [Streptomyces sp. NPDC059862]|uniref:hypothetical protein n=1 Tax=unclassified Streptomyces TaxID=2593676 RepID=UPI00363C1325
MNTERPDNDDVSGETGATEPTEDARGAAEASGTADTSVSEAPEPASEESDTADTSASEAPEPASDESDTMDVSVSEASGTSTGESEGDGAPRPARRRSPAVIASVAAAVLLVGGGGAYLAASAGGGAGGGAGSGVPAGDGTPPPLALDGYSEGATNGIAPGEPDPNGVTYRASGALPDGPGSAPVYRATGEVTKAEVTRLAKALGLDGTPVSEGQAWRIGGQDGQGPSLQVNRQAPGTWTFSRYVPGTDNCESTTVCAKDPGAPAADPVSEATARKAAAPVLKAVGQDAAEVDAGQVMGAQRVVNAEPEIGGLATYGWPTGITVGAGGEVVAGSGQLKAPVKGDTYPVLGAAETLKLMNAAQEPGHRVGIGGCASPVPLEDRPAAPCAESTDASSTAARPEPVEVEDAVFGLASHFVQARQTLVPSWLFEVRAPGAEDGFTVTYPAIDPEYLTSTTPSAQPSPRPSAPGDEPTSAPTTRDVRVEGYTAEGRELTVSFTGGVCADYEAKATESADRVTVTVTETPWKDKVCILIAKVHHRTVQLDEPLGDRKVVGSDGKGIPLEKSGARLPE